MGEAIQLDYAQVRVVKAAGGQRFCLDRYTDVAAALRDKRFGAAPASPLLLHVLRWTGFRSIAEVVKSGLVVAVNPPDHTRLRKIIDPFFRGLEAKGFYVRVQEIADELLAKIPQNGPFDLIANFAGPLPTRVITELIGFPPSDFARLKQWTDALAPLIDSDLQRTQLASRISAFFQFKSQVRDLIQDRLQNPREDLLSRLAQAYAAGEMSLAEAVGTAMFVLSAGHATTTHLIGTGILSLLNNPEQMEQLREDGRLIDGAVEEMIRYNSPIQRTGRVLLEDVEIRGQLIRRNSKVRLMIGAANRDPSQFLDPDRFDITRSRTRHVGFGGGIHQCLGLQLARMETKIAIGELVRRFPRLQRLGGELRWVRGTKFKGLAELQARI